MYHVPVHTLDILIYVDAVLLSLVRVTLLFMPLHLKRLWQLFYTKQLHTNFLNSSSMGQVSFSEYSIKMNKKGPHSEMEKVHP